jgi:hypothetical protein
MFSTASAIWPATWPQEISFGLQAGDAISADALAFHNEWNPYHRAKAFREKHIFRGELTLDRQIAPP